MSEQAKADWRALRGRQIDAEIARRLGWKVNNNNIHGSMFGTNPQGSYFEVPYYVSDASTYLPLEQGESILIEDLGKNGAAAQVVRTITGKRGELCHAVTLAMARALAWLSWKDAR